MQVAIVCAGFTPTEADAAPPQHGDVQVHRRRLAFSGQADRRHGRATATRANSPSDLHADRGLRQLRFSGKPRRELRADRLRLVLDEMPPSGCVLLRAAERAADGVLRAGADRARCARARRRGAAGLRQRLALGLHAGAGRRALSSPCGSGLRMVEGAGQRCMRADADRASRRRAVPQRRGSLAPGGRAGRGAGAAGRGRCVPRPWARPAAGAVGDPRPVGCDGCRCSPPRSPGPAGRKPTSRRSRWRR